MTSDEALNDDSRVTLKAATRELGKHFCRVIGFKADDLGVSRLEVTNDHDAPEWIECTPAAIMAWLGY